MIDFDWIEAQRRHPEVMFNFLKAVHDKPMSEDDFVAAYMAIPKYSKAGNRVVRHEKTGRKNYKRLKERFGFFGGNA